MQLAFSVSHRNRPICLSMPREALSAGASTPMVVRGTPALIGCSPRTTESGLSESNGRREGYVVTDQSLGAQLIPLKIRPGLTLKRPLCRSPE